MAKDVIVAGPYPGDRSLQCAYFYDQQNIGRSWYESYPDGSSCFVFKASRSGTVLRSSEHYTLLKKIQQYAERSM